MFGIHFTYRIEMRKIKNYPEKTFDHAVVAVDVVLFTVLKNKLNVLLLKLDEEPFVGKWALPGGLVTKNENLEGAARRHLRDRAGITDVYLEQLYTFGDPDRDPRGWVVSVAYFALIPHSQYKLKTMSRFKDISWKTVDRLPSLAYDHEKIIRTANDRLRSKLEYTNIIYSLMPEEFTLTELQKMYEILLNTKLDKRNFRKKIESLGLLEKLNKKRADGAHRPANLYSFKSRSPTEVNIL